MTTTGDSIKESPNQVQEPTQRSQTLAALSEQHYLREQIFSHDMQLDPDVKFAYYDSQSEYIL